MKKAELRKLFKEKRSLLDYHQKDKLEDLMLIQFQQYQWNIPDIVMTYEAIVNKNEYDCRLVANYCSFKNPSVNFVSPVMDGENIKAILINEETIFEKNNYGIEEPKDGKEILAMDIEMIFVPLLCFDESGNRVGYGKGYYDKFLKNTEVDAVKIGFSFFDPVSKIEDIDIFDIKLNFCVTPNMLYQF